MGYERPDLSGHGLVFLIFLHGSLAISAPSNSSPLGGTQTSCMKTQDFWESTSASSVVDYVSYYACFSMFQLILILGILCLMLRIFCGHVSGTSDPRFTSGSVSCSPGQCLHDRRFTLRCGVQGAAALLLRNAVLCVTGLVIWSQPRNT